ncbi:MAG TPA: PAS domain-containing protein [Sphingomonas sp.]|uniref:PAS domain-containing protein n=1 Tax=Sphingomonas sp. TaxID=28214 RepID=UPI002ED78E95
MTDQRPLAAVVSSLSAVTLASVLDQSVDCVKLVGLDGTIQYMNGNGLCAMEVDDLCAIQGQSWADLWPDEARGAILASYEKASAGEAVRFRAFCPTARGTPKWWDVTVSPVSNAGGVHAGFLSISRDVTENQATSEALTIAAAEMKHRLKNTYTMIGGLLHGYARGDAALEAFAGEMAGRLAALSTAQSLFVSDQAPCEVTSLIPALVAPFDSPACPVVIDALPATAVEQGQADAIALVIGELAVNSAKHGALARGGSVHVGSAVEADRLSIRWTERMNGRILNREREGGQGLRLMERIVRARRGSFAIDWRDDGLAVELVFALA